MSTTLLRAPETATSTAARSTVERPTVERPAIERSAIERSAVERAPVERTTAERPARAVRPATGGPSYRLPGPSSFDERLVPRFRRRRVPPGQRRQRRLWATLRGTFLLLVAVGVPLALTVWVFTAPQLSFRGLDVTTAPQIPVSWVEAQLEPLKGRSLLLLSLAEVERRIEAHPWVAGVAIRKRLPDALEVEVVARTPAAVLEHEGRRLLVDAQGRPIAAVEESGSGGLLVLSGACDSPADVRRALDVAAEVGGAPASTVGNLTAVDVLGDDDFRLHVDGLPFPLVVRAGGAAAKIAVLEKLLPEVRARFERMKSVDLRFSRKIVLQPEPEGSADASLKTPSRG